MKNQSSYFLFLCCLIILLINGCRIDHELQWTYITNEKVKNIAGEVFIPGESESDFYDIQVYGKNLLLLDYKSKSKLQVFDLTNGQLNYIERDSTFKSLAFTNQLFYSNDEKVILYDELCGYLYEIALTEAKMDIKKMSFTISSPPAGINVDIHLNDSGYYYIKSYPTFIASYIYRNVKCDDAVVGEPYDYLPSKFPDRAVAFLSHFFVNEKENVIYTASRFTNSIQRYGINGELDEIYILGEKQELPILNNKGQNIDIPNSKKYFIQIYGTNKYVYCLYSGSSGIDCNSKVLVFNWKGKYINSYDLNRSVSCIAIEQCNNYLYGIARNSIGETEVLKYSL